MVDHIDRSEGRPGSRGGDGGVRFPGFSAALGAAVVSAKVSHTVHNMPAQRTIRRNGREFELVTCCLPVAHTTDTLHDIKDTKQNFTTPHITVVDLLL